MKLITMLLLVIAAGISFLCADWFGIAGLAWWSVGGTIGALIGGTRGHVAPGAVLGMWFGPLGWLFAALADSRVRCPICRETIQEGAKICRSCRSPLAWTVREAKILASGTNLGLDPDDWQNQHVEIDPQRAEWAANSGGGKRTFRAAPSPLPPPPTTTKKTTDPAFDALIDEALGKPKPLR